MERKDPKQKAKEMTEDFLLHVHQGGESHKSTEEREFENAKDCAIAAVGYLIKETGAKYWYDVKREISSLNYQEFSS